MTFDRPLKGLHPSLRRKGLAFDYYRRSKFRSFLVQICLCLVTIGALVPLFSVFIYVLQQGLPALNLAFFTETPKPVGEVGGGMANSLAGTLVIIGIASLIGIPVGVGTGLYLSEYGQGKRGSTIRFLVDILASIPSIVVGLFAYSMVVLPMKRFSALAGGIALSIIMIPTVARSAEELLKLVPQTVREAGLALGLPRWKVTLQIVLKGCRAGIITGVILALARIAGETAPLLFTALNNRFWSTQLDQPMSTLPVQIYSYAISPFDDWHRQAWAGALVLVLLVLLVNLMTRIVFSRAATTLRGWRK
ncbi:MAG: phosphate ABC transporter permease PstA [Oligoflexia bacterium]|nr:phosphate ABC transporter permease PstA [Oligoflexia bacterium]